MPAAGADPGTPVCLRLTHELPAPPDVPMIGDTRRHMIATGRAALRHAAEIEGLRIVSRIRSDTIVDDMAAWRVVSSCIVETARRIEPEPDDDPPRVSGVAADPDMPGWRLESGQPLPDPEGH